MRKDEASMAGVIEEFKHETLQDQQSVVRYLEALGQGISDGRLFFRAGGQELLVHPHGLIRFSVKAQRDGRRVRVTARFFWKEPESDAGGDAKLISPPLTIEGKNPAE